MVRRSGVTLLVVALLVVTLMSSVSAQLNFSPGWGKRAAGASGSNGGVGEAVSGLHPSVGGAPGGVVPPGSSSPGDSCGPIPVSAVMHIYRLIRSEAVRLVQCQDEEYLG
uniref:Red pigment-concentrating prohormone n=1 Tax=Callinectes sapidus TaxID=6763 RepID=RPCH_CALSI|nr:RecName: Full=Red pigment-concentrating prohormone; Contains: RecName: Full=Red pigment-concentrating hormone; Short=RPCH; Contains: RecName: Full=RPCH-related peptide; Flags: Precursor [Callinectes sapidus]AAC37244.1 red pigment-concentrating hormone [Callinectes sapidus]AAF21244.1 red pigment concentrating hormone precursor [Callinectes sapidus]prf//2116192A red pigment-concentrating hormone precursor [Callinectes sapidus]